MLPNPNFRKFWDFPGDPVVKILCFHCTAGGVGSIPGQGTKILHAASCGQKLKINLKN